MALHSLGFTAVTPRDSEVLIANIDIGGDGKVQYDDFVRLLCPPKQEMRSVTCSEADVARINALVPPTELNLPGRVFFMGGRAVKRVLGPGEAAALRHSSLGDVGNGVASDPLRESVLASVDAAETTIRRGFYKDLLGSSSSSSQQEEGLAVSEAEEGAQAAEATLSHLRATASTSATASSSTSPLRRTTARREARVELASLPPAVQVDLLMSRGLLPQYQLSAQAPRLHAPWEPASAEPGPSMEERIAAAHASNAAGAAHAARLAAGEVGEEEGGMAHSGAVHVSALYGASSSSSSRQLPEVPTHLSLPISPLARTAATAARRGAGSVPALVLPGTHRGALAPSTTVTLSHPLSYLTALGSSALAPPPQLLHTLLAAGSCSSGDSTTAAAAAAAAAGPATAPPNSLDRSLHASGRLPARSEGLSGPLSSTGAPYQHDAVVPDGGSGTVVVGHLQGAGKGCESVTAVGASAIALVSGPFFSSTVQRELDRRINRLRLSAQDVLELPAVGRPTAPHVTQPAQAAVPPFSPLRSGRSSTVRGNFAAAAAGQQGSGSGSGSGSAAGVGAGGQEGFYPSGVPMDTRRLQRHEARRREFFTAAGLELPSPKEGSSSSSSSAPEVTLAGRLSSSRNLRQSRLGSILGLVNPLTQGADAAAAAAAAAEGSSSRPPGLPPLDFGSLASISTAHTAGGSRVLATAVRHEGERTTFLLASPPSLRTELTPEHPSYHYASSARLAQTGTAIPEQAFGRLARVDALHGLRERALERAAAERSQHDHDYNFAQSDIASRIARKREERGAYKASIFARKLHQERTLCAPFPVGDVQI